MRRWVALAAVVVLAGCGTAHATAGPRTGTTASATAARTSADSGGTQAKALALARHLVAEMRLPPGTRLAHPASIPRLLRRSPPLGAGWASAERLLVAPGKPAAVWKLVLAYPPFNEPSGPGVAPEMVSTMQAAPAPGIDADTVSVSMTALSPTTTLVAAYAYAAWLPVRTADEHLAPASFRAVTISANQIISQPHHLTRTFTSTAIIVRLAASMNALTPAPVGAVADMSCPPPMGSYTLRFVARNPRAPAVVISTGGCLTDSVTVHGKPQPLLWDTHGTLTTTVRELLHF